MNPQRFIAGNWKMYKTVPEAVETGKILRDLLKETLEVRVAVCPPFTALQAVSQVLAGSPIAVGAQDLFWEREGAFTGEVSAPMLVNVGCRYVIVGHSERRQFFGETDFTVNRKLKSALAHGLTPIFCVGETLQEREEGQTFPILERQIRGGLSGIPASQTAEVVLAYEPVWAIGTGKTATPEIAQEAHAFIRTTLMSLYGEGPARRTCIQYGGSVKPENIAALMAQPDINGALVGGASLDPRSFAAIVQYRGCEHPWKGR